MLPTRSFSVDQYFGFTLLYPSLLRPWSNAANVFAFLISGTLSPPCGDPDGDSLTVISPTSAPTFTLAAGQSYSYQITVSDGNGGTGTGTITYTRQ